VIRGAEARKKDFGSERRVRITDAVVPPIMGCTIIEVLRGAGPCDALLERPPLAWKCG